MPLLSGRHNRRQVIFEVALVGVAQQSPLRAEISPSVLSEPVMALVDTGAVATSISPAIAGKLNLRPGGRRDVMTANGLVRVKFYEFQVALIGSAQSPFYVLEASVRGNELNTDSFGFDILLGMDVISQGDLSVRRDGRWSFEF
jgi:predicted aspartyl protease